MYAYGEGVLEDDAKAVSWYRKAADQGDEDAQARLRQEDVSQLPETFFRFVLFSLSLAACGGLFFLWRRRLRRREERAQIGTTAPAQPPHSFVVAITAAVHAEHCVVEFRRRTGLSSGHRAAHPGILVDSLPVAVMCLRWKTTTTP